MKVRMVFIFIWIVSNIFITEVKAQERLVFKGEKVENGALLFNDSAELKVNFINPSVVRVRYTMDSTFVGNATDVCVPREETPIKYKFIQDRKAITIQSSMLKVVISKYSGAIKYYSAKNGTLLLRGDQRHPRSAIKIQIKNTATTVPLGGSSEEDRNIPGYAWEFTQRFVWQPEEALYGLGSDQQDYMDLRGTMQYLYPHNLKKDMPVLMSTKGYGLLFNAGCAIVFRDDKQGHFMKLTAANELDYYFMYGPSFDQIVHHYRTLTGRVPMLPKYAIGYVQSKEHYASQHEIDSVVREFRRKKIPLDVIVQDWLYWKPGSWGTPKFDSVRYPDPGEMIKFIHDNHTHYMISIWPQIKNSDVATSLKNHGFMLCQNTYNAFDPKARKVYWEYLNSNLFKYGVDAWWADNTEPVVADWSTKYNSVADNPRKRFDLNVKALNIVLGPLRATTYALEDTKGIYLNQRKTTQKKRVLILTRSSYAGEQRYGVVVWSGDASATWGELKLEIPQGLNFMATGFPYWTVDIGGFFVKKGDAWFWRGGYPKGTADLGYRELYTRWFEYGAWLPMFRSHGTGFAREPWEFGGPGGLFYKSLMKTLRLRYRLLPYVYSVAWMVTSQDYTMTRTLAFDFRKDTNVYNIKDQFLFGPDIMACPVTRPMYYGVNSQKLKGISKTRPVYLPKGTDWIDFWTGKKYAGGQNIIASAPIDHIPIYIKAGSIIPMGPNVQYTSEKPDAPWEIRIYPGANGSFTVYQDEGNNYDYENGAYAIYTLNWNNETKTLSITDREGKYPGMAKSRTLHIIIVHDSEGIGETISRNFSKTIEYIGKEKEVHFSQFQ